MQKKINSDDIENYPMSHLNNPLNQSLNNKLKFIVVLNNIRS